MKTIAIDCPACHSKPGEPCIDVGVGDQRRNPSGFHIGRAARARLITSVEKREAAAKRKAFSVKKYGAVGDGATDDRQAFSAAHDAARGKDGGR